MGNAKKVGISVVSVILVVGCIIGSVMMVKNRDHHDGPSGADASSTSMKTVNAICAPTQYKDACVGSLKDVATNKPDATTKDYLEAAVKVTLDEVKKALEVTNNVVVDQSNDPSNDKVAVESCKRFLQQAIEQLDATIAEVGKSDNEGLRKKTEEFIAYLTGANIYQHTCVDELVKEEYKSAVENGMKNATQLTDNALYIFAKINDVMMVEVPAGLSNVIANETNKVARRLLSDDEVVGHDGDDSRFPEWVSAADRKLLGVNKKKGKHGKRRGQGKPARRAAAAVVPGAAALAVPAGVGVPSQIVVAQDGSGQFTTINAAINAVPATNTQRFTIHVKAGIYREVVQIRGKDNVFLLGDGQGKTIITNNLCFARGVQTSATATVAVDSNNFMAKDITFENSAGPDGHQAVALRINGEKAVVFQCEMRSYQDTLYYHKGLQFYKNCLISGSVDFIFGNGRAILQDCTIVARKPGLNQQNMITADGGLSPVGQHGLVLQNCHIIAEAALLAVKAQVKTYLGRPWKAYAVTAYMQSDMGDFIVPAGYSVFTTAGPGAGNENTAIYAEFANTGPGANTNLRDRQTFKNFKVLNPQEAGGYTVGSYIQGPSWLPASGVPFKVGL